MKILKAGGEKFTGSSGGKSIRNIYMALNGADALVLMTAHREFREQILIKNIEPVYQEPRPGDIKHSLADISRARTFGYEPESDFKEELRETIRWFSNNGNI